MEMKNKNNQLTPRRRSNAKPDQKITRIVIVVVVVFFVTYLPIFTVRTVRYFE
jgi:hypothetical protein